ncbi:hypothetical protein [Flagellimonas sp.]|uniref:hypothetical protein n=1 Tax=Flagellimonas sp. TaxID=2058762 RepID=UPI003B50BFD0
MEKVLVSNVSGLMLGQPGQGNLHNIFNLTPLNQELDQGWNIKDYKVVQFPENSDELNYSIIWILVK